MSLPAYIPLSPYRGDTWAQTFRLLEGATPVDLTGATVASEARALTNGASVYPLVASVIDPAAGEISLQLPAGSLPAGAYDYDIEIDQAGQVTTWIRGRLTVRRDVTNELV